MNILVTGGAGFIGSNFIHYWLENYPSDYITNLDILTYAGNLENLSSIEKDKNYQLPHSGGMLKCSLRERYKFVKGDICDRDLVDSLMDKIDVIVHFAAESHVDRSIIDSTPFVRTNVLGTQILLDAALKHNVGRFHHVSTDEVFGDLDLDSTEKFNETTPYNPHSPYSASKAASDHLVRAYFDTHRLPITISNCSNNFGPYQYPEKFISVAVTNLLEGKKVPIYGDGKYVRDWLYVEDHCKAIDLIVKNGKEGETYCVGGQKDKEYSNLEIVEMIIEILELGSDQIEFVKDRPAHDRRYAVDWSKIQKELGWEPEHKLKDRLRETVNWYRDNKDWWVKIKSGEYKNYYKKQYGKSDS